MVQKYRTLPPSIGVRWQQHSVRDRFCMVSTCVTCVGRYGRPHTRVCDMNLVCRDAFCLYKTDILPVCHLKLFSGQVDGGQQIDLRPMAREHFNTKTMVAATSPSLLLLCGDMRCYRLLETPLQKHLKVSLPPVIYMLATVPLTRASRGVLIRSCVASRQYIRMLPDKIWVNSFEIG